MAEAVVALTSAGASAIAQAIGGTKLQITSVHFGSDLINSYSQEQLEALTEVVSNGTASAVYESDSSVISYLYPAAGEIQLRVNLGTSIGDFTIGNWGLVDSKGTLLFIIGLAATDYKSKTSDTQAGDNRIYVLNIPLTSNLTDSVDFSILNVDAAALPEVTTETNLPSVDTSAYPVFHIQNYDSSGAPCLASRANEEWYYYLPLDSLLARDNTWTGTNTYTKTVTAESDLYVNGTLYTNKINANSGTLNLNGGLNQTSEFAYVKGNQLLARGWDGTSADHVVKTIGVGWGDSLIPFVEYYNTAGTSSGDTTLLRLATVNALDNLLTKNNTWTGTNTYTKTVTAESDLYVNGTLYTNAINANSGTLNLNGGLTQTSEAAYVSNNHLLTRGWNGSTTDHVVKTIGVGWGDSLIPFVEYYNTAGTSSGDTTLLRLATVNALDNLLTKNNTWTGTNTFNQAITANSDLDCKGVVYTNTLATYSGTLTVNSDVLVMGVLNTENQYTIMNRSRAMNGNTSSGGYCWGNGLTVYGYGEMSAGFTISDVNGDGGNYRSGINLTGGDYTGKMHQWYFHWDDYLYDGNGNKFLKAADVTPYFSAAANSSNVSVTNIQGCNWALNSNSSYLQVTANDISLALPTVSYVATSITSYAQPKGDYALSSNIGYGVFDGSQGSTTSGTIVGGTWLRLGTTLIQSLIIENIGGGRVTFPYKYSGLDTQISVIVQDGTGSNNTYTTGSITTSGTGIHAAGGGGTRRLHLIVTGPYGT